MGEIIVCIVIGGSLVVSGIIMIYMLNKEQKSILKNSDDKALN